MIRTIIIDDEPSAVQLLAMLLKKHCKAEVEIVATSTSPQEGRELIERLSPDLVFLDIEMPGMTGIDLLHTFSDPGFQVVFVTAYDDYALEAFRLSAVDYLLKPIEVEEVIGAVEKIKKENQKIQNDFASRLAQLEKLLLHTAAKVDTKIGIAMADKIVFVSIADILYCEAQGGYALIYLTADQKILSSKPLGDFETQLAGHKFFRIHHHYLINLNRVKEFQRHDGGYVILENNITLEVSQRKRKDFLEAIQNMVV